ncbi:MAG TPA: protein kinase [Peptococcaceae bacterium]|nr:MAG: Serine/threonine protein kinase [Clostridia bacterium 41_269]HBT20050.1 protein kinase [Peptococcaceae bacterium]
MVGTILSGRYAIIEKLGSGGMSIVYKGEDLLLGRTVAVKVLKEQFSKDKAFVDRFRREAQAGARLSHPNIVSIFDVGMDEGRHFLVMEFVEGQTLKEYLQERGGILEEEEVIQIGIQICEALEHAHENGLFHRDIKPHNILRTNSGKVKVADFGIARACGSETVTFAGSMIGSVHYFSPEQAKGYPTDNRTDIYSASAVLYELATGVLPFSGDNMISVALKHINEKPKPPREINPLLSREFEQIILKGMSKNPVDRFASAGEMKNQLSCISCSEEKKIYRNLDNADYMDDIEKPLAKRKIRPRSVAALFVLFLMLTIAGYYGVLGFLKVEETVVPNVTNIRYEEAVDILNKAGLRAEVAGRIYHSDVPKGYVISHNPEKGERVKKNRIIEMIVSLGPETAEVPNVAGKDLREAKVILNNAGFNVSSQISFVFDSHVPENTVVRQIPAAGTRVEKQETEILLIVSKGPEPVYLEMPDLRGLTFAEAEKKLEILHLKLGNVSEKESRDYFDGQVISQSIPAGTSILQGSSVDLTISSGPGPSPQYARVIVPVPKDEKKKNHRIRIEVTDAKGTHEEYNEVHRAGDYVKTRVPFYKSGVVKIYNDGDLIYEKRVP